MELSSIRVGRVVNNTLKKWFEVLRITVRAYISNLQKIPYNGRRCLNARVFVYFLTKAIHMFVIAYMIMKREIEPTLPRKTCVFLVNKGIESLNTLLRCVRMEVILNDYFTNYKVYSR